MHSSMHSLRTAAQARTMHPRAAQPLTSVKQGVCGGEAAALRHAGRHPQRQHARALARLLLDMAGMVWCGGVWC